MSKKLGVIVPYRDREEHLSLFIPTIESILEQQNIPYQIFIIEQNDDKPFNRGKLLNIGAKLADEAGCDYIVLHDVDMIPIEANYSYNGHPVLLATMVKDTDGNYIETFDEYFGGVVSFPLDQFKKINGYSNEYWGWGFEDDDLLYRSKINNLLLYKLTKQVFYKSTVGLEFNGYDSYIKSPMPYGLKNYTILVSINPYKFKCDPFKSKDEFSIFSILDNDNSQKTETNFTYSSFNRYQFETHTKKSKVIHTTGIQPPQQTVFCITVNQFEKESKLYQNGDLISTTSFNNTTNLHKSNDATILIGNNGKLIDKDNQFNGIIDYFAIFNHSLEPEQVKVISTDSIFGLTEIFDGYLSPHSLEVLYDMKIGTNKKVYDLSGKNRHGEVYHCNRIEVNKNKQITDVPYHLPSTFQSLSHTNNGYNHRRHQWSHNETRKNQIRFYNEVLNGNFDFNTDGLSTSEWEEISVTTENNITHIKVNI